MLSLRTETSKQRVEVATLNCSSWLSREGLVLHSKRRDAFVTINKPVLKENRGQAGFVSQEGLNH